MNYIVNAKCEIFISQLQLSALVWCEESPDQFQLTNCGWE